MELVIGILVGVAAGAVVALAAGRAHFAPRRAHVERER